MGQYYRGAILRKDYKESKENPVLFALYPYDVKNNGAKLLEHSYIGNHYVGAYMRELSDTDGKYFNYPFVWVGDYADEITLVDNYTEEKKEVSVYNEATDIEDDFKEYINENGDEFGKEYKYIVNFTKNEYVVVPSLNLDVWDMHPLSLLTAFGNGRGGGDYYEKEGLEDIGRWAFDNIGVTNDEKWLEGKTELTTNFKSDI